MAYINKTSSGLLNTKLTDVGRRKLASGKFNVQYFQIGDSEVSYSAITNWDSTNNYVLEPSFNAQNDTGAPQSNRQNVKYPFYDGGLTPVVLYYIRKYGLDINLPSPIEKIKGNTLLSICKNFYSNKVKPELIVPNEVGVVDLFEEDYFTNVIVYACYFRVS
jgi:hypothetical protein